MILFNNMTHRGAVVVSSFPLGKQKLRVRSQVSSREVTRSRIFLTAISDCTDTVTKVSIKVCNVEFKLRKRKDVKGASYMIYLVILGSCRVAVSSLRHFKVTVGLSGSTSPP